MSYSVNGAAVTLDILHRRPQLHLKIDDGIHTVVEIPHAGAEFELLIDGTAHRGWRCRVGNEVWVRLGGRNFIVRRVGSDAEDAGASSGHLQVRAQMPGIVVAVHCEVGQSVRAGDKLLTMESMKLQVTLAASGMAVVERIHVAPEVTFARDALLVTLASTPETDR